MILDSYALSLYTFLQLEDERRLNRLLEEGDRLSLGGLVSVAFNDPKKLQGIEERYKAKLRGRLSREEAFRIAADILKREAKALQKISRNGKRRQVGI